MSFENKIRLLGVIDMSVDKSQLTKLMKLLEETEGRMGPIFDEDYNPWGGKKIREFVHLAPIMRNREFINHTLKKYDFREVPRIKVVEGLDGGMEPMHMHIGNEVYLLNQMVFDKLIIGAKIEMNKLEAANTVKC